VVGLLVACADGPRRPVLDADEGFSSAPMLDAGEGVVSAPGPDAGSAAVDAQPPAPRTHDASAPRPLPPRVSLWPELEPDPQCADVELELDFDPTPAAFDVDQAFWMMWFSERTFYSHEPEVERELREAGFERYAHLEDASTGLQLFVAGSDRLVIVGVRGSTELQDWLADFNFPQDEGSEHGVTGRVHRGFARALVTLYPQVESKVREFADAGQTVWVTGHSLGGAEATLIATRLAREGFDVGPLYTFGAPRAGDGTFALDAHRRLGERVYRVVNERDLVPRVPPTGAAADAAARVLPFGKGQGTALVRDLDYRHAGSLLLMPHATGKDLEHFAPLDDGEDVPYWEWAAEGGALGALVRNRNQGERHAQQRYLCRLLALRRATTPNAPL
jgi:triacylglycerol lipase